MTIALRADPDFCLCQDEKGEGGLEETKRTAPYKHNRVSGNQLRLGTNQIRRQQLPAIVPV